MATRRVSGHGQDVADTTRKDLAEALSRFQPSVSPDISYVRIPDTDRYVIAVSVAGDREHRPFYYRHTPFWRVESTTSPMSEDVLEDLVMLKGGMRYVWEGLPASDATIADLDHKLITGAVRLGIYHNRLPESAAAQPVEDILQGLHLLTEDGRITNAAMVLFGKDLWPAYPQCLLRMAKFRGTKVTDDFVDNRQGEGNIYVLLDAAMSFFVKHLNISGSVNPETWQRDDELDIPRKALRESVINACAHRLYHRRGSSIGIAIFDDRIEIENTGTFPLGITEDTILSHDRSEPMNPLIANVLYKTSYLEHWGRGVRMMHDLCVEKGLKAPTFTTTGFTVKTTFFFGAAENVPDNGANVPDKAEDVPDNVPDEADGVPNRLKGDSRRAMILRLIEINPKITTDELAEVLRVSRKTVTRDLTSLARDRRVVREGGAFGGKWVILE